MDVLIRPAKLDITVFSTWIVAFGSYPRSYTIPGTSSGSTFESSARVGCSRLTATIPSAVRKPSELEAQLQGRFPTPQGSYVRMSIFYRLSAGCMELVQLSIRQVGQGEDEDFRNRILDWAISVVVLDEDTQGCTAAMQLDHLCVLVDGCYRYLVALPLVHNAQLNAV